MSPSLRSTDVHSIRIHWNLSLTFLTRIVISLAIAMGGWTVRADTQNWAQWRGPLGTGAAIPPANPPVTWGEREHVRWKTKLPGLGHSSPIIWQDHVFVTTAVPVGEPFEPIYSKAPGAHDNAPVRHRQQFAVLAIDRRNGSILWRKDVGDVVPHEGAHFTASFASNSPVTDGERIYAFFGSRGLCCLDFNGNVLWRRDLGPMRTKHGHGEGASPALHGNTIVINYDHEANSFVTALDSRTGELRWRVARPEPSSWATPITVPQGERVQVIVSGTDRIRAYDLKDGSVIWQCGGLSHNVVASPVADDGIVVAASSYEKRAMIAIRLEGARGDITDTDQVVWQRDRATPYVPSPLVYGGTVYFLRHYQGILSRVVTKTGEERPGPLRLGPIRDVYASPVAAAGRIYVTDLDGNTLVISHGEIPRILSHNRLDDRFAASAALADDQLFLRGHRYLYCLSAN